MTVPVYRQMMMVPLDVILSEDAPQNTTNWLPVGAGGFHLFMRIYTPDMHALETWMAPTITEILSIKCELNIFTLCRKRIDSSEKCARIKKRRILDTRD